LLYSLICKGNVAAAAAAAAINWSSREMLLMF
jgi:hypothetical protein